MQKPIELSTMKTVIVTSQKGGTGKTTLVRNLAAMALKYANKSQTVGIVDSDPQGTLTTWWKQREAEKPHLAHVGEAGIAPILSQFHDMGATMVFVDTPPSVHRFVNDYLVHSDFALVPVKASPDDLSSVGDTLALIHQAQIPFAMVLNQAKPRTNLLTEALTELSNHGPVAKPPLMDRTDFPTWAIAGQSVIEAVPKSKAASEVTQLFSYLCAKLYNESSRPRSPKERT